MKGKTSWDQRPHLNPFDRRDGLHICRIAPDLTSVELEWLDLGGDSPAFLEWRELYRGEDWHRTGTEGNTAVLTGLVPWMDYQVRLCRADGTQSAIRFFRTGEVPGRVIHHLHPKDDYYAESGKCLCSPSLLKLPSGRLLASMDVYRGGGPQNRTLLFRSDDRGENWHYVCDVMPLFWGDLFYHNGRVYYFGCSTEFGDIVIGASDDEGEHWTAPTHLFDGGCTVGNGWEQSPMPVMEYKGRLYFSMEAAGRQWGRVPVFVSVPSDADLLDASNWVVSEPLAFDPAWLPEPGVRLECFIEGNLFVSPEGDLRCMFRCDGWGMDLFRGKSPVLRVSTDDPERAPEFLGFVDLPIGFMNKFFMRRDPVTGLYIAIGNLPTRKAPDQQRNVLALCASEDAVHWRLVTRLIDRENDPIWEVGFQYPSWLFDGDDILMQVRTAINGARNFHDANYSTFHVIRNFRDLLRAEPEREGEQR